MQIVIAWAEKTKMVPTGGHTVRDRNLFPEFGTDWEGKAAMWLRDGNQDDIAKAETFARREGHLVFTFDRAEKNALEAARRKAVEIAKAAK